MYTSSGLAPECSGKSLPHDWSNGCSLGFASSQSNAKPAGGGHDERTFQTPYRASLKHSSTVLSADNYAWNTIKRHTHARSAVTQEGYMVLEECSYHQILSAFSKNSDVGFQFQFQSGYITTTVWQIFLFAKRELIQHSHGVGRGSPPQLWCTLC